MAIRFTCPNCTKTIKADASFAGKHAKCPNCATKVAVPELEPIAIGGVLPDGSMDTLEPVSKLA